MALVALKPRNLPPWSAAPTQFKWLVCMQEVEDLGADAISESLAPNITEEMIHAFDTTKPFTYQFVFDVAPKLRWKKSYKGLEVPSLLTICSYTLGSDSYM